MRVRWALLAAGVCAATACVSWAADTIQTNSRKVPCRVIAVSAFEIEFERTGTPEKQAVNEVVTIFYEGEPNQLTQARDYMREGRYDAAVKALERVKVENVSRTEILQDVEFFRAYCHAQMAKLGEGEVSEAGREMAKFVGTQKSSYHWLEANEIVGDLLVASGLAAKAVPYYEQLGKAPWPDYKMRSGVGLGRALLAENKAAEARQAFDTVLAAKETGPLAEAQRLAATLGKARIMVLDKNYDEAVKAAEAIIAKANPEQVELLAQAYNTLGTAQRAAGANKDALMSFLHVEVLYAAAPDAHAEALYNLAQLWDQLHKSDRALQARRTLAQKYKNSPWAKK